MSWAASQPPPTCEIRSTLDTSRWLWMLSRLISSSKRVVWAADREHGIEWDEDVPAWEGLEAQAVKAAKIQREERERQPA